MELSDLHAYGSRLVLVFHELKLCTRDIVAAGAVESISISDNF